MSRPNILYIMCDQFRFDCIHALGNNKIVTPNIDRLVRRGLAFTNAYSTCPVCAPARYTIRTGCEPHHTGCYANEGLEAMDGLPETMQERCGPYLAAVMGDAGYKTFGIGKFHTLLGFKEDLGYDIQHNIEEMWGNKADRQQDAYAAFIADKHPEYAHIEQLHGERTNMYYIPQMSPMPAELTSEAYVADLAINEIRQVKDKPYFGFVSFIGPHPPCAPPVPFNRYYNPDDMDGAAPSDISVDFMDEQIPWMNYLIWADDINDFLCRSVKSRYYGEITYIDQCIGRILDAVEERDDADNTLIAFFSDHGDHMGDHHAWQKESYFESSCHVPFLLSWPKKLPQGKDNQLVCLTDLFGIACRAAEIADEPERDIYRNDMADGVSKPEVTGKCDANVRDGYPVLDVLAGRADARKVLTACYGRPGTPQFKIMVRWDAWKYIFIANGGREQLFSIDENPQETKLYNNEAPEVCVYLRQIAERYCDQPGLYQALNADKALKIFAFTPRPLVRICQFDTSSGVFDFKYHMNK